MRQRAQRDWSSLPPEERRRQFRRLVVMQSVILALYLGLALYQAHQYVVWSQAARQYHATPTDARAMRLVVDSRDEYRHSRGRNSYVLGLREPGGRERTVSVLSRDLWQSASVGDAVTAQVWHDRVCRVQALGISSATKDNPEYRAGNARSAATVLGGAWLVLAALSAWSMSRVKRRIAQMSAPFTERVL